MNYDEAVATLKRRFGNKQSIIKRHMNILLRLEPVTLIHNLKGLRQLFDAVESKCERPEGLGCCGQLIRRTLIAHPDQSIAIRSRELKEDEWNLEPVKEILQREIEAREHSAAATRSSQSRRPPFSRCPAPTALSLTAGSQSQVTCAYYGQTHSSADCQTFRGPAERKKVLRSSGRSFICLRRSHISRNCRSSSHCAECNGKHHTSLHTSPTRSLFLPHHL